jgi:hypothetical protein
MPMSELAWETLWKIVAALFTAVLFPLAWMLIDTSRRRRIKSIKLMGVWKGNWTDRHYESDLTAYLFVEPYDNTLEYRLVHGFIEWTYRQGPPEYQYPIGSVVYEIVKGRLNNKTLRLECSTVDITDRRHLAAYTSYIGIVERRTRLFHREWTFSGNTQQHEMAVIGEMSGQAIIR